MTQADPLPEKPAGTTRRDALKVGASAMASTLLPGATEVAAPIAEVATPVASSLLSLLHPSRALASALAIVYGEYGEGTDLDDNRAINSLSTMLANLIIKSRQKNFPPEKLEEEKERFLRQLVTTGYEIGKLVAEEIRQYDRLRRIARQFNDNPNGTEDARAWGGLLSAMRMFQGEVNEKLAPFLKEALDKGEIIEYWPQVSSPEEKAKWQKEWQSKSILHKLNDLEFHEGPKEPHYIFTKKMAKHLRRKFLERLDEQRDAVFNTFDATSELAAKFTQLPSAQYNYDHPLVDSLDTIFNTALHTDAEAGIITPQTILDEALQDPRKRFTEFWEVVSPREVESMVKKKISSFVWDQVYQDTEKIFGKGYEKTLQAEFERGFYEHAQRCVPDVASVPDHTRSEKLSLKTAIERVNRQDWSSRGAGSRGLG